MDTDAAEAAWQRVRTADVDVLDAAELSVWFESLQRVRAVCDAAEVAAIGRRRALAGTASGVSTEAVVASDSARSGRDARTAVERSALCTTVPAFESALAAGEVSSGHLDVAARALRGLDELVAEQFTDLAPELVHRASILGVDAFGRECRDLARHLRDRADQQAGIDELERQRAQSSVKRWIDRATGMHHTLLALDPLRDSMIWTSINASIATLRQEQQTTERSWQQLQADAVVTALTATPAESGRSVPEVSVLIDWASLHDEAVTGGVCETFDGVPLPVATVRRLCCDADIIPLVLGGRGEVLDLGRSTRSASRAQRRALAAMHRGCAFPGCDVGFDACKMHHVRWWAKHNGRSDLHNLLPLCERHHHLVHEGRWELAMDADRVATWRRPDGAVHHRGSTLDRRAEPIVDVDMRTPMLC